MRPGTRFDTTPLGAATPGPPPLDELTTFERLSVQAMDGLYRHAVPLTEVWLRRVSAGWMTLGSSRMMYAHGLDRLRGLKYSDGVLLVSNHRSFFDMYMLTVLLHRHTELRQPVLCPVRAGFFYQSWPGVLVNLLVGGGRMFPPFFREAQKQDFNRWALSRVVEELKRGQVLVGFHPEGRRNQNASPYEPLPAQPGVGKIVMDTWPIVVPAFIHGLTNDIVGDVANNFFGKRRVIAVFGEPMDLSPYRAWGNRLASHKRIADALTQRIYELGEEERRIRTELEG